MYFLRKIIITCCIVGTISARPFDNPQPAQIVKPTSVEEIQQIVRDAAVQGTKLSIGGARKSQGGQTVAIDGTLIDMSAMNKVLSVDKQQKLVTVQTGAVWENVQKAINGYGLSLKSMQSYSSNFTVGGGLSVNVHGQDTHFTQMIQSVVSFRIVMPDGTLQEASRSKNYELFRLAIGGYGLLGVITDATLSLTDNVMVKKKPKLMNTNRYVEYFKQEIKNSPEVALHSARLDMSPNDEMLSEVLSITYWNLGIPAKITPLKYSNPTLEQYGFNAFRKAEWLKYARTFLESALIEDDAKMSRNEAMHSTLKGLANWDNDTIDILQEHFIPLDNLYLFLAELKRVMLKNDVNLLNATIRYLKADTESFLSSYAPRDAFGIVLFINLKNNERTFQKTEIWSQELINAAIKAGGTYYLPYHLFATQEQLRRVYPQWDMFVALKRKYDPQEIFMNALYRKYAQPIPQVME